MYAEIRSPSGSRSIMDNTSPPKLYSLSPDTPPSDSGASSSRPGRDIPNGDTSALSIFAPPPSATLPEALQAVIAPDGHPAPNFTDKIGDKRDQDGDTIMQEADAGFASRLRQRGQKEKQPTVLTGVSASGKDVPIMSKFASTDGTKKKGKGRAEVDIVSIYTLPKCSYI
jgi:hypothetical protein